MFATTAYDYSPSDLTLYQQKYGIPVHGVTDVNGHASDSACVSTPSSCGTTNLMLQVMTALSQYPTTTTYYTDTDIGAWLLDMADTPNPPLVQILGYIYPEANIPITFLQSFDTELVKVRMLAEDYPYDTVFPSLV